MSTQSPICRSPLSTERRRRQPQRWRLRLARKERQCVSTTSQAADKTSGTSTFMSSPVEPTIDSTNEMLKLGSPLSRSARCSPIGCAACSATRPRNDGYPATALPSRRLTERALRSITDAFRAPQATPSRAHGRRARAAPPAARSSPWTSAAGAPKSASCARAGQPTRTASLMLALEVPRSRVGRG
jgi:hypothetical protein